MLYRIRNVLLVLLVLVLVVGLCLFHYKVWRLKHPTAPTWTYFVSED